jgi:eukaryotic-like serine/threonine-protein kinase
VPFDVSTLEVRGSPVAVIDGVRRDAGKAAFEVADSGTMVYIRASLANAGQMNLAVTDRHGVLTPLALSPAAYDTPRVSPDGKFIAVAVDDGTAVNVWIQDLLRTSSMRRVTFGGNNRFPVWSPDGQRLAFQSDRGGDIAIYWQQVNGSVMAERATTPPRGTTHIPESWSKHGVLLFSSGTAGNQSLRALSLADGRHEPFGGVESRNPIGAAFSPDGAWVAYAVLEPPSMTIYVQPFPATGEKFQVSRGDDGHHPVWSPDGKELYFVAGPGLFSVAGITTAPAFTVTGPVAIEPRLNTTAARTGRDFDLMPDGRLLGLISQEDRETYTGNRRQLQVVVNWLEELKAKVPVN